MSGAFWTGYQIALLGTIIGLLRYGLTLPPSMGRTLIRIGAAGALIESVLWLLRVVG